MNKFHIVWSRIYEFTLSIQDTYCLVKVMLMKVNFFIRIQSGRAKPLIFDPFLIKVGVQVLHLLHCPCSYDLKEKKTLSPNYATMINTNIHILLSHCLLSELCTHSCWFNFTCTSLPEGFVHLHDSCMCSHELNVLTCLKCSNSCRNQQKDANMIRLRGLK